MNLNCCFLVSEERSLFFKQYFLYSLLTAFIGFIGAGHCFDIALQSPHKIKAGPSVYTQTKYVLQIIIACFSIFLGVYLNFKYEVKHPSTLPMIVLNFIYFPIRKISHTLITKFHCHQSKINLNLSLNANYYETPKVKHIRYILIPLYVIQIENVIHKTKDLKSVSLQ